MPEFSDVGAEGQYYLDLLNLGEKGDTIVTVANQTIPVRDFLLICGDSARPRLQVFEKMSPQHPKYLTYQHIFREMILGFINPPQELELSTVEGDSTNIIQTLAAEE